MNIYQWSMPNGNAELNQYGANFSLVVKFFTASEWSKEVETGTTKNDS